LNLKALKNLKRLKRNPLGLKRNPERLRRNHRKNFVDNIQQRFKKFVKNFIQKMNFHWHNY